VPYFKKPETANAQKALVIMAAAFGALFFGMAFLSAQIGVVANGIVLIAMVSALLIVAFQGSVAGLVPLFTVGAFLTFTLSQAGMVRHWWKKRGSGWHWRLGINAIGAATTALVLAVVLISKFTHGAWIVVMILPVIVLALRAVGRHNRRLQAPETLPTRWWHPLLRNYLAWRLKWALLFRPRTSVVGIPYEVAD